MSDQVILLLVEDEPLILAGMQDTLEDGGYTCLTASDGHAGMTLIDCNIAVAQALITDVRMEGPDGWALARHARTLRRDIPIIYTTADSAPDWTAQGVPNSLLLIKPYAEAQLIAAVSQSINAASSGLGAPRQGGALPGSSVRQLAPFPSAFPSESSGRTDGPPGDRARQRGWDGPE